MSERKAIDFEVNENGCFICTSHKYTPMKKTGYPGFFRNGKRILMHRHVYEECFGPIPVGLLIRHKCDTKGCINPEHLETGTHADNMRDKAERNQTGIYYHGSTNKRAKLNEEKVSKARELYNAGKTMTELAKMFNVSFNTMKSAVLRKKWKHVK